MWEGRQREGRKKDEKEVGGREQKAGKGKNKHIIRVTEFPVQLESSFALNKLSCGFTAPSGWVAAAPNAACLRPEWGRRWLLGSGSGSSCSQMPTSRTREPCIPLRQGGGEERIKALE